MAFDETSPAVVATRLIAIKHRLEVARETCSNVLYALEQLDDSDESYVLFSCVNDLFTEISDTCATTKRAVALAQARLSPS